MADDGAGGMKFSVLRLFVILCALSLTNLLPSAHAQMLCNRTQCLRANDVAGIRLDMTIQQAAALFPDGLRSLGGGQFKGKRLGISYDLGFTPLGHLYRIDSSQYLGSFVPDRTFGLKLTQQLTKKYGPPQTNMLPTGPASWSFVENYESNTGMWLSRGTESLSAMLAGGYGMPISLDMKMMDFRILRRDAARMNEAPESNAQGKIHF